MTFTHSDRRVQAPFRRWAPRLGVAFFCLVLLAVGAVWAKARMVLQHHWTVAETSLSILPSAEMVEEGERLFHVFGCNGCHLEAGRVLFEQAGVGRLVAPNLAARLPIYDDTAFAYLVRRGVRPDGTSLMGMPTKALDEISDRDLAAILAYLRQLEPQADAAGDSIWGPLGLAGITFGAMPFSAETTDQTEATVERPANEGAYLARTICTACHNLDTPLDDGFGLVTPALRSVALGYDPDEFRHLLRTGEPIDGRDLGLMTYVSQEDLRFLTDAEIDTIHAFLNYDPDSVNQ